MGIQHPFNPVVSLIGEVETTVTGPYTEGPRIEVPTPEMQKLLDALEPYHFSHITKIFHNFREMRLENNSGTVQAKAPYTSSTTSSTVGSDNGGLDNPRHKNNQLRDSRDGTRKPNTGGGLAPPGGGGALYPPGPQGSSPRGGMGYNKTGREKGQGGGMPGAPHQHPYKQFPPQGVVGGGGIKPPRDSHGFEPRRGGEGQVRGGASYGSYKPNNFNGNDRDKFYQLQHMQQSIEMMQQQAQVNNKYILLLYNNILFFLKSIISLTLPYFLLNLRLWPRIR